MSCLVALHVDRALRAVLPHARRHALLLTSSTITPVGRQSDRLAFYSINSNI